MHSEVVNVGFLSIVFESNVYSDAHLDVFFVVLTSLMKWYIMYLFNSYIYDTNEICMIS